MLYKVTLIPGDGTGPEIVAAAKAVIEATGIPIEWEVVQAGQCAVAEFGEPIHQAVVDSIRKNKVALKGPLTNIVGSGFPSPNVTLRQKLDLFANIRHAKSFPGAGSKWDNVDLIVVRESLEDSYGSKEQMIGEDAAIVTKFITRKETERVMRKAFDYARALGRKKLTVSVKANILKLTDGLFLKVGREVSKDYPDIQFDETIIDALTMHLVREPQRFDVIVTENVYGDIVSDLAAGLAGSLGLGSGSNYGENGIAVFEPVHGSAPKYANLDKVNPTAEILSGALMLRHLGEGAQAVRIERAVAEVIAEGKTVTYDLGGNAGTKAMSNAIIEKLIKGEKE